MIAMVFVVGFWVMAGGLGSNLLGWLGAAVLLGSWWVATRA